MLVLCLFTVCIFFPLAFLSAPVLATVGVPAYSSFSSAGNLMFSWLAHPEAKLWSGM